MSLSFVSTRGGAGEVSLRSALFSGLAPDGGLYLPASIPRIPPELLHSMPGLPLSELATVMTRIILADSLSVEEGDEIARSSFSFPVPLVPLDPGLFVLELFHGPTLAFKDFGARFMARLMARFQLRDPSGEVTVLTATSGDTGGAVAQAFAGLPGIRVVVLYPRGRVSPRQERQFATLGGNVEAVAVRGSFDDCQRLVKQAFSDRALSARLNLTSANSINIGRLLPQVFYYAWAWSRLAGRDPSVRPVFVTPSGNFGNLAAGILALRMGIPIAGFVAPTNRNRVFGDYLETGVPRPRPSVATPSSAMDVGDPSNLERIQHLFAGSPARVREWVEAPSYGDEETLEAIRGAHVRWGYTADPHTAVGLLGAVEGQQRWPESPVVVLSTAHPAKFPEAIEASIGESPDIPPELARVMELEPRFVTIAPEAKELNAILLP